MNGEKLKILLEKYYRGETTEMEETELKDFFRSQTDVPGYETEKMIFGFYDTSVPVPEPSGSFEERILLALDKTERKLMIRRYLVPALSTAAGILILVGSWFIYNRNSGPADTFSDPEIAYAETMKILLDVSEKMNHASETLEPVAKFNTTTRQSMKIVNSSAKQMKKGFSKLETLNTVQTRSNSEIKRP